MGTHKFWIQAGFPLSDASPKACPDVGFEFNELLGHRDLTSRGWGDHKRSAGKMHKIYGKTQWYGKTKWPNDPMTQCHKSLLGMIYGVGFTMQNTTWRSIYTIYNELCGKSLNVKWLISSGSLSNRGYMPHHQLPWQVGPTIKPQFKISKLGCPSSKKSP